MKHLLPIVLTLVLFSCGNERKLILPEIENAEITELHDVSHAYLFYDETKKDSVDLNRKNLISTTNWLINVDKRLTLEQAIPKIKLLQEKKRKAKMHKNEAAKNYYTCNDTIIKNLGFLEFTDVHYKEEKAEDYYKKVSDFKSYSRFILVTYQKENDLNLIDSNSNTVLKGVSAEDIMMFLDSLNKSQRDDTILLSLNFNKDLRFSNYISLKHDIVKINHSNFIVDTNEFIY